MRRGFGHRAGPAVQCVRPARATWGLTLEKILDCLNATRCRATYKAVGESSACTTGTSGFELGHRCPRNCWIVNRSTGQPSGYTPGQMDPNDRLSRLH